jgi:hypothetical protein
MTPLHALTTVASSLLDRGRVHAGGCSAQKLTPFAAFDEHIALGSAIPRRNMSNGCHLQAQSHYQRTTKSP